MYFINLECNGAYQVVAYMWSSCFRKTSKAFFNIM